MAQRVAMISLHTSPLASPGRGDAGGLNVYVQELGRALAALDVEVDIFTRSRAANARREVTLAEGLRVITLPAGPARALPKEHLPAYTGAFARSIVRYARDAGLSYDLVHGHYWLSGLVGLQLCQRWGTPLVQMFHTLARLKAAHDVSDGDAAALAVRLEGEERVLAGADAVVTATALERQALLSAYDVSATVVHAIPCGVDGALFRPGDRDAARRRLGLGEQRMVFAAGRFDRVKGFEVLLEAAAMVHREQPSLRVIIAGGPKPHEDATAGYRRHLLAIVRELGLEEQVSLPGPVARSALPLYYRAADACVVPSYYESFGLTALEAMACGTPVVASRVGGLQLTIHDGENGFLVPAGDAPALAARLGLLLGDDGLRLRLGRVAARTAEPYSWSAVADRMLCLYRYLGMGQLRQRVAGG